ncbi:unnamed protein product [Vitrella brassicaformis CCMP3155]|uniref:RRM domain-containing protein n=1 Tax=Vitrella brassicaformis (strain CCMP3155) TaxID=1169540 RepID=A0A0G4EXC4_VITBC|nr:unnamed protein product [Vitrella brassicaformis CCMP3155]|eukprot:CEM03219.1 unnamed protein product [Vitrella brassicaformis CCMP3155]
MKRKCDRSRLPFQSIAADETAGCTNGYPAPTDAHPPPHGGPTPLTDDGTMAQKRQGAGPSAQPGRVLLIRDLPRDVNELEIKEAFSRFTVGQALSVFHVPSAGQTLVQFPDGPAASAALAQVRQGGVVIGGCTIQGDYSNADCRILLVNVTNLGYPVEIDALHRIFSAHGPVKKIDLLSGTVRGVAQALIQFENLTDAAQAVTHVNGHNMYDGCNTLQLQVQLSGVTMTELSVGDGPNKGRDFTIQPPTAHPAARGGVNSMPLGYSNYAPPSPMGMPPQDMSAIGGLTPPPLPPTTHPPHTRARNSNKGIHGHVTDLIQQQGADPNEHPQLRVKGSTTPRFAPYPLLALCIDNLTDNRIPSIWAADGDGRDSPVALPQWSSPDLQEGVMKALIAGGVDINAIPTDDAGRRCLTATPVRVAIRACNETAFGLLMAEAGLQLGGRQVMRLPSTLDTDRATEDHEATLLSFYRQLIDRDPTLATETDADSGGNPLHWVIFTPPVWSQAFIDSYIDLLVANGADMTAVDIIGATPLQCAAMWGFHRLAASLCRRLPSADINRGPPNRPNRTPLWCAAQSLWLDIQLEHNDTAEAASKDNARARIPHLKSTIRVLLEAGADIARLPNATEGDRRARHLVLAEHTTVLNEVPRVVMAAINAALAPQRDHSMLLARLLPLAPHHDGHPTHPSPSKLSFGPQEAEAITWKIGSFLHEPHTAMATVDEYLMGESLLKRRVRAAVAHFVTQAATRTTGNREVVGGTRHVQQEEGTKRTRVTIPPLQCFAVNGGQEGGGQHRRLGVREVVHRARLDEAAQHGVEGVVKGFNTHLDDSDCQFQWQQLGYINRGGQFEALQISRWWAAWVCLWG